MYKKEPQVTLVGQDPVFTCDTFTVRMFPETLWTQASPLEWDRRVIIDFLKHSACAKMTAQFRNKLRFSIVRNVMSSPLLPLHDEIFAASLVSFFKSFLDFGTLMVCESFLRTPSPAIARLLLKHYSEKLQKAQFNGAECNELAQMCALKSTDRPPWLDRLIPRVCSESVLKLALSKPGASQDMLFGDIGSNLPQPHALVVHLNYRRLEQWDDAYISSMLLINPGATRHGNALRYCRVFHSFNIKVSQTVLEQVVKPEMICALYTYGFLQELNVPEWQRKDWMFDLSSRTARFFSLPARESMYYALLVFKRYCPSIPKDLRYLILSKIVMNF